MLSIIGRKLLLPITRSLLLMLIRKYPNHIHALTSYSFSLWSSCRQALHLIYSHKSTISIKLPKMIISLSSLFPSFGCLFSHLFLPTHFIKSKIYQIKPYKCWLLLYRHIFLCGISILWNGIRRSLGMFIDEIKKSNVQR